MFDNPIAQMYGPHFLMFYSIVAIFTIIILYALKSSFDETGHLPRLKVPVDPNPYHVAYFRGGENEVIRLAIFNLMQQDFIVIKSGEISVKNSKRPTNEFEQDVYDFLALEQTVKTSSLFSSMLPDVIAERCKPYEKIANDMNLVHPPEYHSKVKTLKFLGWLIVVGLALYKIMAALSKSHSNIGFLIILMIIFIAILSSCLEAKRLTKKGKKFIDDLQAAFGNLKENLKIPQDISSTSINQTTLAMGIFGVAALSSGGMFDEYRNSFLKSSSVSSCGSGCGSSCGGGGGCGGGCGGCGGCG